MNAPKTWLVGVALTASAVASASACAAELTAHNDLTLRRGPGTKFPIVTTVGTGQKIIVLWCNGTANWCLVDDGLMQGWTPLDTLRRKSLSGGATASGGGPAPSAATLGDASVPALPSSSALGDGGGSHSVSSGVNVSVGSGGLSVSAGPAAIRVGVP